MRRVAIVEVSDDNIGDLFRGDMTVVSGVPDDARLVNTWHEPSRRVYCFMFESEEFLPTEEGEEAQLADISIVHRRVNTATHWVCPDCFDVLENGDVRNE